MVITVEKNQVMALPRQLKGTWSVEPGVFYTPNIPNIFMNPASALHELHKKYILWRQSSPEEKDPIGQLTEVMQSRFPGPYVVEEFYNAGLGRFDLRLRFADPKQETMWRIKYG